MKARFTGLSVITGADKISFHIFVATLHKLC
jgi:hypothetical protein